MNYKNSHDVIISHIYLWVHRGTVCNVVISQESEMGGGGDGRPPIIFNPDFFVEKMRHERPEAFTELVLSNITRLIDLPGAEFSQLLGDEEPKTPNSTVAGGFFRSFNFLKRKGQVFFLNFSQFSVFPFFCFFPFQPAMNINSSSYIRKIYNQSIVNKPLSLLWRHR